MNLFPSASDILGILFCFAFKLAEIEDETASFLL